MQTPDPAKKRLTRITCAPFTADYLRAEVEAMGFEIQEQDAVGVHVGASLVDCMPLNLQLRTAQHVLWLLTRFRCPSPDALYKEVAAFPWEALIANDGYVSVVSNVEHPKVTNSLYPSRVVKDAIVDRIAKHTGARPDSGPDRSQTVVNLYWKGDRAWVYLNTSGERLGDRGYRKLPHHAPMRETLAAAVLLAAGYDGDVPLINPMCGSGTLAIEAALIATGRATGLLRSNYGLLHTKLDVDGAWREARREAGKLKRGKERGAVPRIVASDHDPIAIDAARRNARAAGVEQHIEFVECDFAETPLCGEGADSPSGDEPGIVIMNAEYGERMGEVERLAETYSRIGDFFKQRCAGWTGFVFTGSRELAGKIGLRASRKMPFMNAKIECRLLRFELYAGRRGGELVMAKKEMSPAPAAKIALYEKAVATAPGIARMGAKNPYTSLNGHMFSFLQPDGTMALRLGKDEREAFFKKHRSKSPVSYGAVMKEYVAVPASLLKRTEELAGYVAMRVAYIESLPPKATTKKKAPKKAGKKTGKKTATMGSKTASKRSGTKAGKSTASKKMSEKKTDVKKASKQVGAKKQVRKKPRG